MQVVFRTDSTVYISHLPHLTLQRRVPWSTVNQCKQLATSQQEIKIDVIWIKMKYTVQKVRICASVQNKVQSNN